MVDRFKIRRLIGFKSASAVLNVCLFLGHFYRTRKVRAPIQPELKINRFYKSKYFSRVIDFFELIRVFVKLLLHKHEIYSLANES